MASAITKLSGYLNLLMFLTLSHEFWGTEKVINALKKFADSWENGLVEFKKMKKETLENHLKEAPSE